MKIKTLLLSLLIASPLCTFASDFFSTEDSPRLFTFGVRAGVNASNRTFSSKIFNAWNVNSWGSGIEAGIVANLNFKDYLAIQPGVFFNSRSGNYSYAQYYINTSYEEDKAYQNGHTRSYNFTIPVLAIIRFNPIEQLKWSVEVGPYVNLNLHTSDADKILILRQVGVTIFNTPRYEYYSAKTSFFDAGLKIGSGLTIKDHYYFGIHYLAGFMDAWKDPKGGKNKSWTFTLGYDF